MDRSGRPAKLGRVTDFVPGPLDRSGRFYVAGHRGLVGSAIVRRLERAGFTDVFGATSSELDLRDRTAVFRYVEANRPAYLAVAAAKVGGILANNTYPVDFLSENLQIQVNLLDAARTYGVQRLIFLGSSCGFVDESGCRLSMNADVTDGSPSP